MKPPSATAGMAATGTELGRTDTVPCKRASIALAALLFLAACTASGTGPADAPAEAASRAAAKVTLMTFNVENLFDTVDDPGKDDKAFLPLAAKQSPQHRAACGAIEVPAWRAECLDLDWNEAVLERKLAAIGAVIRAAGAPDVIAFQEVEHAALLDRLRDDELDGLGYGAAILIEGSDLRGIDVAFLSRLPLAGEPRLHPLAFPGHAEREGDTRGILEATFRLPDGSLLTGFAVHFPAPYHPTAMREEAYAALSGLLAALPPERTAFAAGDFNTTSTEAAATGILETHARPDWHIAHEEAGCEGCRGTYYYARDDNWSFLDMILVRPGRGGDATWGLRPDSARVANPLDAQRTRAGTPLRFDPETGVGVSDHWPFVVTLETTQKQ